MSDGGLLAMVRSMICGVLIAASLGTPVHANAQNADACRAMSATIAPRQAEIDALQVTRDAAAANVEDRADAWEDAEALRLVSAGHAAAADAASAAYEDARKLLARNEMALQANVRALNDDFERFNRVCAADN